jgi:hypothetical protein
LPLIVDKDGVLIDSGIAPGEAEEGVRHDWNSYHERLFAIGEGKEEEEEDEEGRDEERAEEVRRRVLQWTEDTSF